VDPVVFDDRAFGLFEPFATIKNTAFSALSARRRRCRLFARELWLELIKSPTF